MELQAKLFDDHKERIENIDRKLNFQDSDFLKEIKEDVKDNLVKLLKIIFN